MNLGFKTNEIGFVVKAPNGTVVAQRIGAKEAFPPGIIMASFCPVNGCPTSPYVTVNIRMSDSFGDGWSANVLAVKQNDITVAYLGSTFTTGSTSGPVPVILQGNAAAQIYVFALGKKTSEVGFSVTAPDGTVISERASGIAFSS